MNRRSFLTGLLSTSAAIAATSVAGAPGVARVIPQNASMFVFQNRLFFANIGSQTVEFTSAFVADAQNYGCAFLKLCNGEPYYIPASEVFLQPEEPPT